MRVDILQSGQWHRVGEILPEADEVPISRIVRIPGGATQRDSVRIRISVLADTWMIDALEADRTAKSLLQSHPMAIISAVHSTRGTVTDMGRFCDQSYAMMFPGVWIDLRFGSFRPLHGGHVTYACEAGG